MPVYNCERYVAAAIESILSQTYVDFELLILEDGSSDATAEISREFAARDPRIRLLAGGGNKGIVARLNEGVEAAQASIIARMDGDDISLPHRFETQMRVLEAEPDLVLLGSRVVIIDPEGAPICEMGDALTHEEIDGGLMGRQGQLVYHPSVMMRKADVEAVGGYREQFNYVEDLDLFLRLAERGRLRNLEEPLLHYREHFQKTGAVRLQEQEARIGLILAEARERRGLADPPAGHVGETRVDETRTEVFRKWGWWALAAGNISTARKYAARAILRRPFSVDGAKLVYCALRGR